MNLRSTLCISFQAVQKEAIGHSLLTPDVNNSVIDLSVPRSLDHMLREDRDFSSLSSLLRPLLPHKQEEYSSLFSTATTPAQ